MKDNNTYSTSSGRSVKAISDSFKDLAVLVKLRLSSLVVFSAIMAALIASNFTSVSLLSLVLLGLGGFLITGAANALNQVLEKDFDLLMKRTQNRPVATGVMSVSNAVLLAGLMSMAGITLLSMLNPSAAILGAMSLVFYAFIYTPMKRVSTASIWIGAVPGALPTMIGCAAVEGHISALALGLFAIQFLWQFPHFYAIAWLAREDYRKAGFKVVPKNEDVNAGKFSLITALLIVPIVFILFNIGIVGVFSLILLSVLTLLYAILSYGFYQEATRKTALRVMFASFIYLPLALGVILFDVIYFL